MSGGANLEDICDCTGLTHCIYLTAKIADLWKRLARWREYGRSVAHCNICFEQGNPEAEWNLPSASQAAADPSGEGGLWHEKCQTRHFVGHCPLPDDSPQIHTAKQWQAIEPYGPSGKQVSDLARKAHEAKDG